MEKVKNVKAMIANCGMMSRQNEAKKEIFNKERVGNKSGIKKIKI